jgi:enoyl-CoA hydratase
MNEHSTISLSVHDKIATIAIDRQESLNALNAATLKELHDAFDSIAYDDGIRAVILTGKGKSFIAGADITEMAALDTLNSRNFTALARGLMEKIECIEKIVVAAVNGFALGGGCELALACDIRFASEKAKFGLPEVGIGIIPGFGGTQRLPRLIGAGNAKHLIYSTEIIDAQEAFRIGLVHKVFPEDELIPATEEYLLRVAKKAPIAVRMAKVAVTRGMYMNQREGIDFEGEALATTLASKDRIEGVNAFIEKRPPVFRNE